VTEKRVESDRYESVSNCKIRPISAELKLTISGDHSSKLHIETATTITGIPQAAPSKGPRIVVMEMSRIGPCERGQKPGDFMTLDGKVMRIPGLHQ
jgi:hypothetical protein